MPVIVLIELMFTVRERRTGALDDGAAVVAKFRVALAWRRTSTWPSLAGLVIEAKGFTSPGF